MTNENKMIEVKNLNKSYGKHQVLFDVNFDIYEGELFGLIGKNGAGKSTTIECILGAKKFDSGEILVDHKNINKNALEIKKIIGYVPSEPTCYLDMTGYDYLNFVGSLYQVSFKTFIDNVDFLVKLFDFLEKDLYRPIREYSHGMQQKICLMASLIHNPKIWILDEPTVGLDPVAANELTKLIKEFIKHNKSCFIASHNIEMIAKLCDRVAIVKDGKISEIIDLKKNPNMRSKIPSIFMKVYNSL